MKVTLHWQYVLDDDDERWEECPAIYAYTYRREILYIGKADGSSTVRSRWDAPDKDDLFDYLARERGIDWPRVLVGRITYDGRLTRQVVADLESLLIAALQPRGNIACTRSRITRPGLSVRCTGSDWPSVYRHFVDDG
jgi:hypothetical protein